MRVFHLNLSHLNSQTWSYSLKLFGVKLRPLTYKDISIKGGSKLQTKKWKLIAVFSLAIILILISGCSSGNLTESKHSEFGPMDTVITLRVFAENKKLGDEAISKAMDVIYDLEKELSRHVKNSPVDEININAGKASIQAPPSLIDVVELGIEFGEITQGAFDITIAPLIELWGFGNPDPRVPEDYELEEALKLIDYRQIELDKDLGTIFLAQEGMALDLGGIAKGYIVDKGIEAIRDLGVENAFFDGGGDIRVLGTRPDGTPWRVGIRHPRDRNELIAIMPLVDKAVVTSGDYERYFDSEKDGKRYFHILDPATGYPPRGIASVTVIAPDAATADVYSTAFFVLGIEKSLEIVESLSEIDTIIITEDLKIYVSSGIEDTIELIN